MDTKKISFGFSKVAKKPNILPSNVAKEQNRVELIKCVEGKEIKLVAEKTESAPLVIQMQGCQKTSSALASLMKRRQVLLGEDEPDPDESTSAPQSVAEVTAAISAESLEQRAARELLAAAQANGSENLKGEKLVLPAVKADELPLEGAKEASLDDYDSIPIQQFGLAMLRGMGWIDPPPKKKGSGPVDDAPFLRPKGMGLGADKALKPKALLVQPEKNEVLEIKKQAFVRILGGKQKDQYGQIEGFDDHAGRVIVKMAIGGNKEAFNEFLCQPVSRKEYSQYGKCINSVKYNEFKKQENEHGQIIVKKEKPLEGRSRSRDRREESKSCRKEDWDRKSYKGEDRKSFKDEDRRSYKNEDRISLKTESHSVRNDRSEKVEIKHNKGEYRRPHKLEEHEERNKNIQNPRSSTTSVSRTSTTQNQREERERRRSTSPKNSRRQKSSSDEADDTGESTESDSDSAYERKKHKKKSTKKSKKHSKKSKSKSSRTNDSSAESDDSLDEYRRHPTKHKKKTKKSKHARSRSRSRGRGK